MSVIKTAQAAKIVAKRDSIQSGVAKAISELSKQIGLANQYAITLEENPTGVFTEEDKVAIRADFSATFTSLTAPVTAAGLLNALKDKIITLEQFKIDTGLTEFNSTAYLADISK